jgi:hypothetical protein
MYWSKNNKNKICMYSQSFVFLHLFLKVLIQKSIQANKNFMGHYPMSVRPTGTAAEKNRRSWGCFFAPIFFQNVDIFYIFTAGHDILSLRRNKISPLYPLPGNISDVNNLEKINKNFKLQFPAESSRN